MAILPVECAQSLGELRVEALRASPVVQRERQNPECPVTYWLCLGNLRETTCGEGRAAKKSQVKV